MKSKVNVFHKDPKGTEREIDNNAVDYGDGNVMIQYKDTGDVAIVPKEEIISVVAGTVRKEGENK